MPGWSIRRRAPGDFTELFLWLNRFPEPLSRCLQDSQGNRFRCDRPQGVPGPNPEYLREIDT